MNKSINKPRFKFFILIILVFSILVLVAIPLVYKKFGKNNQINSDDLKLAQRLILGQSYSLTQILDDLDYQPTWIRTDEFFVEIYINSLDETNGNELIKTDEILQYDSNNKSFKVIGISDGEIFISSAFDNSVNITIPFKTKFSNDQTLEILKSNFNNLLQYPQSMLDEINYLIIDNVNTLRIADFKLLVNLKRIVIYDRVDDPLETVKLDSDLKDVDYTIYVSSNVYHQYLKSSSWQNLKHKIFPSQDFELERVSVVFELNGGNIVNESSEQAFYTQMVDRNLPFSEVKINVEKTGHHFIGWYTSSDEGVTYDKVLPDAKLLNVDLKVYAIWEKNRYSIIYDSNDGKGVYGSTDVIYDNYFKILSATPTRTGYTFLGWSQNKSSNQPEYQGGESLINLTTNHQEVITLYAIWSANNYQIKYNLNLSGLNDFETQEVKFGQSFNITTNVPERTGYKFLGWSLDKNAFTPTYLVGQKVDNLASTNGAVVIMYAVWAANLYSISYDANGGMNPPQAQNNCVYGEDITLRGSSSIIRTGYTIIGWSLVPHPIVDNIPSNSFELGAFIEGGLNATSETEIVLYAVWRSNKYTIVYRENSIEGLKVSGIPNSQNVVYDQVINLSLALPTMPGFTFVGWDFQYDIGTPKYLAGKENTVINLTAADGDTVILFAIWKPNQITASTNPTSVTAEEGKSVNIIINVNNGTGHYTYNIGSTNTKKATASINQNIVTVKCKETGSAQINITVKDLKNGSSTTITVNVKVESSCIAMGTKITLADGTTKNVEDLLPSDLLLVWNFTTGSFDVAPVLILDGTGEYKEYQVANLIFSDGSIVQVIGNHGFFNLTLNSFVYINEETNQYIGDKFFKQTINENGELIYNEVVLDEILVTIEYTTAWSPVTFQDLVIITDGILSIASGTEIFVNIFEIDEVTLMIDYEKYYQDIETYGLFTYEDFSELIPEEVFIAFKVKYLKVALGKGIITFEQIEALIEKFMYLIELISK